MSIKPKDGRAPSLPSIEGHHVPLQTVAAPSFFTLAMVFAAMAMFSAPRAVPSTFRSPRQSSASSASAQAEPRLTNSVTREGPFSLGDQQYTVLLQDKVLLENRSHLPSFADSTATLWHLQILDTHENSAYEETFPYSVVQRRFAQPLSASASLLPGTGGVALVLRFLERPSTSPDSESQWDNESWQVFGIVNGHLVPFGPVLPLGRGTDITVGGALAAVMIKGGIELMPMASTAEVLAFRVWTGHFYALVPVRFDWTHGKWGEGEQCYATDNGSLRERGCIMRLEAASQPRPSDSDPLYVHLFETPDGNLDNSVNIGISADSHPEFLDMMAIVQWQSTGQRIECRFRNLWLRIRINGHEGWVHGQQSFAALGLPLTTPR